MVSFMVPQECREEARKKRRSPPLIKGPHVFWVGRGLPGMRPGREVFGHELQNPIILGSNPCSDASWLGRLEYISNPSVPHLQSGAEQEPLFGGSRQGNEVNESQCSPSTASSPRAFLPKSTQGTRWRSPTVLTLTGLARCARHCHPLGVNFPARSLQSLIFRSEKPKLRGMKPVSPGPKELVFEPRPSPLEAAFLTFHAKVCTEADVPDMNTGSGFRRGSVGSQSRGGVLSGPIANTGGRRDRGKIGGLSLGFQLGLPNDKNFQCCYRETKW